MDIICVEHPYLGQYTKSFLVPGPGGGVLIDTGLSSGARRIAALAPRPEAVLSTHGHWDHTGGHRFFQARGALVYAHPGDRPLLEGPERQWDLLYGQFSGDFDIPPARRDVCRREVPAPVSADRELYDGQQLTLGGVPMRIAAAPGHSGGSVCIHLPQEGVLFTGDTVCGSGFFGVLPQIEQVGPYRATLERLGSLDADRVYSAHAPEVWDLAAYREQLRQGLLCVERLYRWTRAFLDAHPRGFRLGELAADLCRREGGKPVGSGACVTAAAFLEEFSTQYETAAACRGRYGRTQDAPPAGGRRPAEG